jgi:hypothetical protein
MTHERQPVREGHQRTGSARIERGPRAQETHAPGRERSGRLSLANLQRAIGNRAVTRLIQRAEESRTAASPEEIGSPLPIPLRQKALSLIRQGEQGGRPDIAALGRAFLTTGQLPVAVLQTGVMARPGFVGQRIELLRRGQRVTVLDSAGAWFLVLTPNGNTGWMHYRRLIPAVVSMRTMRPGDTGSGTERGSGDGGQIIGGRG